MDATAALFAKFGISLLLGLLVGLQREHTEESQAGLRTFPLITLLGSVAALLADPLGVWALAAGMLALAAVAIASYLARLRQAHADIGITTVVAMLLMYAVGALVIVGPLSLAVAVGSGVAVLLQFKLELHDFSKRLGDRDLKAIMQFVLITCIILPVLPNRTFGPLRVFNPFETWLMVALIVGMSLGGYIIYKFFGRSAGIFLGGFLGGMISSTATTVSYARQARDNRQGLLAAAIVIMIASTVLYARVLIEVSVVSPAFLKVAALPILVLMVLTFIPALAIWLRVRREAATMPEQSNPTQLRSAVVFAGMYALVLFALAAAREYGGMEGLYAVAGLSGMTDMDAITLSTARMAVNDPAMLAEGWRLLVVAALTNLGFKAAVAGVLGGWQLLWRIALLFAIPATGGAIMLAMGAPGA